MAIDQIGTNGLVASAIVPPDGSITSAKIADDAVTSAKIGAGAVDATALGSAAVTAVKLASGAVTTDKIGTEAINGSKLSYKEYFRFTLTSDVTGLADNASTIVPFHQNGNVDHDTLNGFSGDNNNTWTAGNSSEDQWWLMGIQAHFDCAGNYTIRDSIIGIQMSVDGGSNYTDTFHIGTRWYDGGTTGDLDGSSHHTTCLVRINNSTTNTLFRMGAYVNLSNASTWSIDKSASGIVGGSSIFDDENGTFWWGTRIY
jgi:hypothetical protein